MGFRIPVGYKIVNLLRRQRISLISLATRSEKCITRDKHRTKVKVGLLKMLNFPVVAIKLDESLLD